MNKKFTMMLAAFLAAGYTITAEAGVVKIANPKTSQSYVITDVTKEGVGFTKSLDGSSTDLSPVSAATLAELEDDAQWTITAGADEKIKLEKKGGSSNGVQYSTGSFTYGSSLSDLIFTGSAILGEEGKYLDVTNPGTAATELKRVAFYAVGAKLQTTADNAIKFGDKYLVVKDGKPTLVSYVDYVSSVIEKCTTKTDGTIVFGSVTVGFDENGSLAKATGDIEAAVFETIEDGILTVVQANGENKYVDANGKLTTDSSKAIKVDVATTIASLQPTAFTTANVVNIIGQDGFPAKSRLIAYDNLTSNSDYKFIVNSNGKTTAVEEETYEAAEDKTNYYWTMSGNTITNSKSGVLAISESQSFSKVAVVTDGNVVLKNAFYLVDADGKYVQLSGTTFDLVAPNGSPTVFSTLAAVETPISAIDLNEMTEGAFSVVYKLDDVTAKENPFENITAIQVYGNDKYANGTYFVVNAPANVKLDVPYFESDADDKKALEKMTFVAVSSSANYDIYSQDNVGTGAKFTTILGKDMVAKDETAKANKVPTNNAVFTVKQSDIVENKLIFVVPQAYVNNEDKDALVATVTNMYVAAVKSGNEIFVTTTTDTAEGKNSIYAEMGSENIVEYKDFLTTECQIFNIKFLSTTGYYGNSDKINEVRTQSEYNKYLGLGDKNHELLAQGADFVDLKLPQNQWIVSKVDEDNTVYFTNREGGQTISAKLVKTDEKNVYRLAATSGETVNYLYVTTSGNIYAENTVPLNGRMLVELTPIKPAALDGYVSTQLDNIGMVKMAFEPNSKVAADKLYVNVIGGTGVDKDNIEVNKSKATQFEVIKFTEDTIYHYNNYAVLKDGKPSVKSNEDEMAVVTYAFKQYRSGDFEGAYYLNSEMSAVESHSDAEDADKFIVKYLNDGSYALVPYTDGDDFDEAINNSAITFDLDAQAEIAERNIYDEQEPVAYFSIEGESLNASYNHVPQHVIFKNTTRNTYMVVDENNTAAMDAASELKAEYTKEDFTFWLDTTDSKLAVPTFYISHAGKYMYNAQDSLTNYNGGTASEEVVREHYLLDEDAQTPRAIFRAASLKDSKTLVTMIDNKEKELTEAEDLAAYQYKIVLKDESVADEYVVRSLNGYTFLYELNGHLGFTADADKAIVFNIERTEAPTSNEGVAASEVKVVAQDGAVVVKNAAGKNVVVSTILGQVVANEVLTSDNATINVPAGIVVVAVEGESFKVNVK